ncbi:hypothetical protein ACNQ21_01580 [Mycoplasma sp. VS299A]
MNTDLYNGYKKIKGLNIAFLVLIFLCIFFLILWLILFALNTVNMTNSMDGNNNSTPNFEDIFGGV